MKRSTNLLFYIGISCFLGSCFEPEVFPSTPNIEFVDLKYFERERSDSLVLSFKFEDGEGDLGLNSDTDILPPFHEIFVYLDSRDSLVQFSNLSEMVPPFFRAPAAMTDFRITGISGDGLLISRDTFALNIYEFLKESIGNELVLPNHSCSDYLEVELPSAIYVASSDALRRSSLSLIGDTLAIERNPEHHNLHIQILRKNNAGDFEEVFLGTNAAQQNCGVGEFNARFPVFGNGDGKEGVIEYRQTSILLARQTFLDFTYKFRFFIYDRAGNKSNEVETFEFVLSDIIQ